METAWTAGSFTWNWTDALLCALGVWAGRSGVQFTSENSEGVGQHVIPTFAVLMQGEALARMPGAARSGWLHAEQYVETVRPLPTDAAATIECRILALIDRGRDSQFFTESVAVDPIDGHRLATTRSGLFVRGAGGFGGDSGMREDWKRPTHVPDGVVAAPVPQDQALLYRLNGYRNPVDSDPVAGALASFLQPILHGLCSFGITAQVLLRSVCDDDVSRFASMGARFTRHGVAGETLEVRFWRNADGAAFQALVNGEVARVRGQRGVRS